jgi:CheY-like chemotaxis protein
MRVLLIEDDELIQRAFLRVIKGPPLFATTNVVDNVPDAIRQLDKIAYDYIVSDFDLKVGTGGDVLIHVRANYPFYVAYNRFILLSGYLRPAITNLNHPLTFEKPIRPQKLRELLLGGLKP